MSLCHMNSSIQNKFRPLFLNPSIWWDADASPMFVHTDDLVAVVNDGDLVGDAFDLSGNGNNLQQAAGAARPVYKLNQQNGLPGVLTNGTSTFLETTSSGIAAGSFSVSLVVRLVGFTAGGRVLCCRSSVDTNDFDNVDGFILNYADATDLQTESNTTFSPSTPLPITIGTTYLVTYVAIGAGTLLMYVNGVLAAPGSLPSFLGPAIIDRLLLGAGWVGSAYAGFSNSLYFAVVGFNYALSDPQRIQLEKYLNFRWNLF